MFIKSFSSYCWPSGEHLWSFPSISISSASHRAYWGDSQHSRLFFRAHWAAHFVSIWMLQAEPDSIIHEQYAHAKFGFWFSSVQVCISNIALPAAEFWSICQFMGLQAGQFCSQDWCMLAHPWISWVVRDLLSESLELRMSVANLHPFLCLPWRIGNLH